MQSSQLSLTPGVIPSAAEAKARSNAAYGASPIPFLSSEAVRAIYADAHTRTYPVISILLVKMKQSAEWKESEVTAYLNDFFDKTDAAHEVFPLLKNILYFSKSTSTKDSNLKCFILRYLLKRLFATSFHELNVDVSEFPQKVANRHLKFWYGEARYIDELRGWNYGIPLFQLAVQQGAYEFLMAVMSSHFAPKILSELGEDRWKEYITQAIEACKNGFLTFEQTISLLTKAKKLGLDTICYSDFDDALKAGAGVKDDALKAKSVRLVRFLLENFKCPPLDKELTAFEENVRTNANYSFLERVVELDDWAKFDLLMEKGAVLNVTPGGFSSRPSGENCPLLRRIACKGNIEGVKNLIDRGAVCRFEPEEYSVIPPLGRNKSPEMIRTRKLLTAIKDLHAAEQNRKAIDIDGLDVAAEDRVWIKNYVARKNKSKGDQSNPQLHVGDAKESKTPVSSTPVNQENPLLSSIIEIAVREAKSALPERQVPQTLDVVIRAQLEQAYQAMLEKGMFSLTGVIEAVALKVNFTDPAMKRLVLSFLFHKFVQRYPFPDIYELLKRNIGGHRFFYILIQVGLFEDLKLIFEKNDALRPALRFKLFFIDEAIVACKNRLLTLEQTLFFLNQAKKLGATTILPKDFTNALRTKDIQLVKFLFENFKCPLLDVEASALDEAVNLKAWDIVELLVEKGAVLNKVPGLFNFFPEHCPLLKRVVFEGNIDAVKRLIALGAACAFESKDYSVLPGSAAEAKTVAPESQSLQSLMQPLLSPAAEEKDESPEMRRTRKYLIAVKMLNEHINADKLSLDKMVAPEDVNDIKQYAASLARKPKEDQAPVPASKEQKGNLAPAKPKTYSTVTQVLEDRALTFAQTLQALDQFGDFTATQQDLEAAVKTKDVWLLKTIAQHEVEGKETYKFEAFLNQLVCKAVRQVTKDADWAMVDFLTEQGAHGIKARLDGVGAYSDDKYCPILNEIAKENREDQFNIFKGLLKKGLSIGSGDHCVWDILANKPGRMADYYVAFYYLQLEKTAEAKRAVVKLSDEDKKDLKEYFADLPFMQVDELRQAVFPEQTTAVQAEVKASSSPAARSPEQAQAGNLPLVRGPVVSQQTPRPPAPMASSSLSLQQQASASSHERQVVPG